MEKAADRRKEQEILEALKGTHPAHVYKRLMVLKLKAIDGLGSAQTGNLVGLHVTSVNRIIKRYDEEGLQALVTKRHDHGNRYMTREEEATFLARFMAQGEAGTVVEVADIHKAYEKAVGHPVTRSALYYILHKHGWRKVMPRGKHPKRASRAAILPKQRLIAQNFTNIVNEKPSRIKDSQGLSVIIPAILLDKRNSPIRPLPPKGKWFE